MITTLDIFNDIVKILNSIVLMEESFGKVTSDSKEFATAFESGKVDEAKAKLDSFSKDLGDLEKLFKDNTLEPAMDLYQKIKQLLHLHVAESEKQIDEMKVVSGVKVDQDLLKLIDGNGKTTA
jgi:hypothetical protein